jgi:AmiR/NasT family two-component response regulator
MANESNQRKREEKLQQLRQKAEKQDRDLREEVRELKAQLEVRKLWSNYKVFLQKLVDCNI